MSDPAPRVKRRWLQFSLRTYLVVSVLGGIGLWCAMYWLREYWPHLAGSWGPPPTETALPGGWKVREHRRTVKDKDGAKQIVRQGKYTLVDQHGYTRCIGWFDNDRPSGLWTYYHDNGRRAMQGECRDGYRIGQWTAWYENGNVEWEIEHGAPRDRSDFSELLGEAPLTQEQKEWRAEIRTLALGGSFGWPIGATAAPTVVAMREGPARTWWDNGRLQSSGAYRFDQREGEWTFWTRDGAKAATGRYERGRRRGKWSEWDAKGDAKLVFYADGLRIDDFTKLESRLRQAIAANDRAAALELVSTFAAIGGDAARSLAPALASRDEEVVRGALAAATALREQARPLLPEIEAAHRSATGSTQSLALIARTSVDAKNRKSLAAQLVSDLEHVAWEDEGLVYDRLADAGEAVVPCLDALLAADDPTLRRQAIATISRLHESACWQVYRVDDPKARLMAACSAALRNAEQHRDPQIAATARAALQSEPRGYGGGF